MHLSATKRLKTRKRVPKAVLASVITLSLASLVACGGSSSDSDPTDPNSIPLDDATNLRQLNVTFAVPDRLQLIGSALTATVTAGGAEQPLLRKRCVLSINC